MGGSLVVPLALFTGCTSILGDFSVGDGGADATADAAGDGGSSAPGDDAGDASAADVADAGDAAEAGTNCATGLSPCGAQCVNEQNDPNHCGSCSNACPAVDGGTPRCTGGTTCGFTCNAGYDQCGTACVDELTDAANCGACGHSCGGGACSAGACQPWAIASSRNAPLDLAIDANNVYWTENDTGGVYQIAKGGGAVVTIKAADQKANSAWAVTTDSNGGGTYVFWTDRANGRVGVAPIGGGTNWYFTSPKGGSAGTYGIAQDFIGSADYVYASDFGTSDVWSFVASSNMTGGPGTQAIFSATSPTGLFEYPGGGLLVTLYDTGTVLDGASGPIASGTNDDARYVTSDGATAYWTASDGNQVWAAPANGSSSNPPTLVSGSESQPWGIASDAPNSVYWVNKTSGTIVHALLSAGTWTRKVLATGSAPSDVRVDSTAVYWTDTGSGQIMRLNK